jgi:hypothetical protein
MHRQQPGCGGNWRQIAAVCALRPNGASSPTTHKEPTMESRDHFLRFAIAAAVILVGGLALAVNLSSVS